SDRAAALPAAPAFAAATPLQSASRDAADRWGPRVCGPGGGAGPSRGTAEPVHVVELALGAALCGIRPCAAASVGALSSSPSVPGRRVRGLELRAPYALDLARGGQ